MAADAPGGSEKWDPGARIDFVHINEGHPENNHRDGFAVQPMVGVSLSRQARLEAGVGPYLSFNTTTDRHDRQHDDKQIGILASVALLYYLDWIAPGLHVRVGYDHADMPATFRTDSIVLGLGYEFGGRIPPLSEQGPRENPLQVSVMGGVYRTNRGGVGPTYGGKVELRQYLGEHFAISAAWVHEGNDDLIQRHGVVGQIWYVVPLSEKWSVSAGAGPYLAQNRRTSDHFTLNGMISLEAQRIIGDPSDGLSVFVRFSRLVSDDDTDRDLGEIGIGKKW